MRSMTRVPIVSSSASSPTASIMNLSWPKQRSIEALEIRAIPQALLL